MIEEGIDDPVNAPLAGEGNVARRNAWKGKRDRRYAMFHHRCGGFARDIRTSSGTCATRVQTERGGIGGRRVMESAGLPARYALATRQLTLGRLGWREQGDRRGWAK